MKYTALCVQWQVNPHGDVLSASWNRKPLLRGGFDAGFDRCYATCTCGTKFRREKKRGRCFRTWISCSLAPHTHAPRDVPRRWALCSLQSRYTTGGVIRIGISGLT